MMEPFPPPAAWFLWMILVSGDGVEVGVDGRRHPSRDVLLAMVDDDNNGGCTRGVASTASS